MTEKKSYTLKVNLLVRLNWKVYFVFQGNNSVLQQSDLRESVCPISYMKMFNKASGNVCSLSHNTFNLIQIEMRCKRNPKYPSYKALHCRAGFQLVDEFIENTSDPLPPGWSLLVPDNIFKEWEGVVDGLMIIMGIFLCVLNFPRNFYHERFATNVSMYKSTY